MRPDSSRRASVEESRTQSQTRRCNPRTARCIPCARVRRGRKSSCLVGGTEGYMCGIVGYIGSREVSSVLVDGLKRLEYRGYDSCGIAIMDAISPRIFRSVGRIARLEEKLKDAASGTGTVQCGIGHTRWATHGRPS